MRHSLGVALALALVGVAACGAKGEKTGGGASSSSGPVLAASQVALGGAVARVGDSSIGVELVASVARAQGISPEEARRVLVEEALLAQAALANGALEDPAVRADIDRARGRRLIAKLNAEARSGPPFTDEEIAAAMGAQAWIDLDRPETRTVVHALITNDTPDGAARAQALRARLTKTSLDADAFIATAKAWSTETGVKVVAEPIDVPFTIDGRLAQKNAQGTLDVTFTKAAFALAKVGDVSEVVKTEAFGWHVIQLVSVRPPQIAPRALRLTAVESVLAKNRAAGPYRALLDRLRAAAPQTLTADPQDLLAPHFDNAASIR